MQQEINKSYEFEMERQEKREQVIHMNQLDENQQEKENYLRTILEGLDKELELFEESYVVLKRPIDFENAPNMRNVKLFIRKRSEEFRNQIKLCMSILERTLDFAENPEVIRKSLDKLKNQLEAENDTLSEIESMYESEVKDGLQGCEKTWQNHHAERYDEIKDILSSERDSLKALLNDTMKQQGVQLEGTRIGNSTEETLSHEDLKKSVSFTPRPIHHQTGEESQDFPLYSSSHEATCVRKPHPSDESHRRSDYSQNNCHESDNNLSPRCFNSKDCNDINQDSNSFNNLNLDGWQNNRHPTQRNIDSIRQNDQRSMQVVSDETEANRPRFGRKNIDFNNEETISAHPNCDESDNNLPSRCYNSKDFNDVDQASNTFNNLNIDDWQNTEHHSQRELESMRQDAQRSMQVVTEATELNRPRFGRKTTAWMN